MKKLILFSILCLSSTLSFAASQKYVAADNTPVREYPSEEHSVIRHLTQNTKVTVFEDTGEWSRLTNPNGIKQNWVKSNTLCDNFNCEPSPKQTQTLNSPMKKQIKTTKASFVKNKKETKATKAKPKKQAVKSRSMGACPCGYGFCYGPRGGRYCITSGGNKSYR